MEIFLKSKMSFPVRLAKDSLGESLIGPKFDEALAPVIAALNAPLFAGLHDATVGLDIKLPAPDYTTTIASVARAGEKDFHLDGSANRQDRQMIGPYGRLHASTGLSF